MSSWQIKIWTPTTHVKPKWMLSFINYVKHLYGQFPVAWVASGNTVTPSCWPLPMRRKLWNTIMTMIGLYKHGHDREGAIIWMAQDLLIQNNKFLQIQAFLSFELLFPFVQVMRGKCFFMCGRRHAISLVTMCYAKFSICTITWTSSASWPMAHGHGM